MSEPRRESMSFGVIYVPIGHSSQDLYGIDSCPSADYAAFLQNIRLPCTSVLSLLVIVLFLFFLMVQFTDYITSR